MPKVCDFGSCDLATHGFDGIREDRHYCPVLLEVAGCDMKVPGNQAVS